MFALLLEGICFAAEDNLSVFKTVYEPVMQELSLPTVVQVELPNLQNFNVAVLEKESMEPQPWENILDVEYKEVNYAVTDSSVVTGDFTNFFDNNYDTNVEFDLDSDNGIAYFTINTGEELTSNGFQIVLDDYVSLPYNVSMEAEIDNNWKTIIAETHLDSTYLNFPETTAENWKITLWHSQPLRLREFKFISEDIVSDSSEKIVWLARPGESYLIYADAQANSGIYVSESPDLLSQPENILVLELGDSKNNSAYQDPDYDTDGVPDINDNCVYIANLNQEDLDSDNLGDACEDHDRDGILDSQDNCPSYSNSNQKDNDGDEIGDACDDEESRVTEKLPWLPWAAMGFAAAVIGLIFWKMIRSS